MKHIFKPMSQTTTVHKYVKQSLSVKSGEFPLVSKNPASTSHGIDNACSVTVLCYLAEDSDARGLKGLDGLFFFLLRYGPAVTSINQVTNPEHPVPLLDRVAGFPDGPISLKSHRIAVGAPGSLQPLLTHPEPL